MRLLQAPSYYRGQLLYQLLQQDGAAEVSHQGTEEEMNDFMEYLGALAKQPFFWLGILFLILAMVTK